MFDYTLLDLCNDYFMTSDMQFGLKNKHSTIMCSLAYYKAINHYLCNHSNGYSCLLDASKGLIVYTTVNCLIFYYTRKYHL